MDEELFFGLSSTGWTALAALATIAAVLIAGIAALFALRQLQQGRDLAEDAARPYVVAYLAESEVSWHFTDFVIKNIGQTAARNLRVSVDPPYTRAQEMDGHEFMSTRFIKHPTSILAPQMELRTAFEIGDDLNHAIANGSLITALSVTVRYEDRRGTELVDVYEIDPMALLGIVRLETYGLHHIAQTLRAWAKKSGVTSY